MIHAHAQAKHTQSYVKAFQCEAFFGHVGFPYMGCWRQYFIVYVKSNQCEVARHVSLVALLCT